MSNSKVLPNLSDVGLGVGGALAGPEFVANKRVFLRKPSIWKSFVNLRHCCRSLLRVFPIFAAITLILSCSQ
jgi:hypothetical protein